MLDSLGAGGFGVGEANQGRPTRKLLEKQMLVAMLARQIRILHTARLAFGNYAEFSLQVE